MTARVKVTELTYEECESVLDREARAELGFSGEEFLRRLDAGEYDCCEHSDLQSTAWLLRGHRGKADEMRPEPFEFTTAEGVVRVEIGYPHSVGVWTPSGGMTTERIRYASVFLDGEPVREEQRIRELLSQAGAEHS